MSDRKIHELKLLENFASDVESGRKNFEIRNNDRGFQTGDLVQFKVISNTGRHVNYYWELEEKMFEITYILNGWGLKDGYVVFGIKEIEESDSTEGE